MAETPSTPARPSSMGSSDSGGSGLFSAVKNNSAGMEKIASNEENDRDTTLEMPDVQRDHDDNGTSNAYSHASISPRAKGATATPSTSEADRVIKDSAMPPPSRPNFKAPPNSAQPLRTTDTELDQEDPSKPTGAEHDREDHGALSSNMATHKTPQPPSRKRSHEKTGRQQTSGDDHNAEPTDMFYEPANAIEGFDWEDLESRYHHQMRFFAAQEQEIYNSFNELCGVWT